MAIFMDDAPHVAATIITLTFLAFSTFALRVYTRITRNSWGMEDWLMSAAALPLAMLSIACIFSAFNGIGVRDVNLNKPENTKYYELGLFWFFLFEVFYCVAIIPIKLSIAFMLVRIAQGRKAYIYSQYVVMVMFTLMNLIAAFYIIFQCWPVSAAWSTALTAEGGHCNDPKILADIYYATTAVNIATDWFTAFMPIPLLWNVKLNFNAKVSVGAILGLGVFASLSACVRLKYTVNLTSSVDYLYGLSNIVLWGYLENGIGMFVGNLATLRPLFRRMLKLGGSDNDTAPNKLTPNGFPSQSRRTYKSFDASYELGSVSQSTEKDGAVLNSTQIRGGVDGVGRSRISSDTESQKQILDTATRSYGPNDIMVSRQINISRD